MIIKCYKNIPQNGKFNCYDVIPKLESAIWTKRFYDVGSFELRVQNNPLNVGDIIVHGQHAGIVCKTSEDLNTSMVYGYDLCGLLKYRYIFEKKIYSGSAEKIVKDVATDVLKTGVRNIDGLTIEPITAAAGTLAESAEKIIAADFVKNVCINNKIGYDIVFTETNIVFKTIASADRTKEIVFSLPRHNIESMEYENDAMDAANVMYYAEKDETTGTSTQKNYFADTEPTGILRQEAGTTSEDYISALNEKAVSETLTGSANEKMVYGVDYQLGDIVTVAFKNLVIEKQITEIKFAYEKAGNKVVPTFGTIKDSFVKRLLSKGV